MLAIGHPNRSADAYGMSLKLFTLLCRMNDHTVSYLHVPKGRRGRPATMIAAEITTPTTSVNLPRIAHSFGERSGGMTAAIFCTLRTRDNAPPFHKPPEKR